MTALEAAGISKARVVRPVIVAAVAISLAGIGAAVLPAAVHAQAVRPEIGKPLQAAQELIRAQRFKEALAKVREADAVPNKSAGESSLRWAGITPHAP